MMQIKKQIQRIENKFDVASQRFIMRHPFLGFLAMFVGMPLFVLAMVCVDTIVLAFPIA